MTLAERFTAIADWVEQGRSDQGLPDLLAQARAACAHPGPQPALPLAAQVQQALETWQTVWPRLGAQREFRQAVIREARLWARRFDAEG